ncbi:unnamed protein product [Protopolystoma xenopodis]|uniref:Uncharacterized protein n=1 Tax=Protopolystoma xenopodis TaxID=117903 RepID=A0A448WLP8_9PLAT|nr:unnamed protein product [Protopolystoma xenopodis]
MNTNSGARTEVKSITMEQPTMPNKNNERKPTAKPNHLHSISGLAATGPSYMEHLQTFPFCQIPDPPLNAYKPATQNMIIKSHPNPVIVSSETVKNLELPSSTKLYVNTQGPINAKAELDNCFREKQCLCKHDVNWTLANKKQEVECFGETMKVRGKLDPKELEFPLKVNKKKEEHLKGITRSLVGMQERVYKALPKKLNR